MRSPHLLAAVAIAASAGSARADAVTYTAPPACPESTAVLARIEDRLGGTLAADAPAIAIKVWRTSSEFVARVDARALAGDSALRVLHGADCASLSEAVTLVVARIARESGRPIHPSKRRRPAARAQRPRQAECPVGSDRLPGIDLCVATEEPRAVEVTPAAASITVATADLTRADSAEPILGEISVVASIPPPARAAPSRARWGGGLSVLGLSGVGALPLVNLGLEVSGYVRRDQHFVSFGASRWVPQDAVRAGASVKVKLDTLVARGGWGPSRLPLRAWGLAELGEMTGMGVDLTRSQTGSARWIAVGAGFGVAWPMSDYARVIGTFEVAVPLSRAEFMVYTGDTVYQPSPVAARAAFGLEVGWR